MGYHKRTAEAKKAPKKKAEKKKPQTKEVLVTGSFQNPMWLKGVDKDGKQVKINVPKRFSNKLLNKQIKVTQIDVNNEEHYKWEP
jgi:ribosomal protein L31E